MLFFTLFFIFGDVFIIARTALRLRAALEARVLLIVFHPDLILLDLIMPEADGTEVAAQIESDWMLHSVPIVFVTALITREEARDGRRIEGHRIIPKPGHASELIKVVEENLPKRFNNSASVHDGAFDRV
jgi:DNA-binding response OmpR family regulator